MPIPQFLSPDEEANVATKTSDAALLDSMKRYKEAYPRIAVKMPKELDEKSLDSQIAKLETNMAEGKRADAARRAAVKEKRASRQAATRFVKRVRATVKGMFGDDSIEYALVGGKPMSEHKRPVRQPKTKPAVAASPQSVLKAA